VGAGAVSGTVSVRGTGGGSVSILRGGAGSNSAGGAATLRGGAGSKLVGGASTRRGGAGSKGAGGAATLRGGAVPAWSVVSWEGHAVALTEAWEEQVWSA